VDSAVAVLSCGVQVRQACLSRSQQRPTITTEDYHSLDTKVYSLAAQLLQILFCKAF